MTSLVMTRMQKTVVKLTKRMLTLEMRGVLTQRYVAVSEICPPLPANCTLPSSPQYWPCSTALLVLLSLFIHAACLYITGMLGACSWVVWLVQEIEGAGTSGADDDSDAESDGYGADGLSWEAVMESLQVRECESLNLVVHVSLDHWHFSVSGSQPNVRCIDLQVDRKPEENPVQDDATARKAEKGGKSKKRKKMK